VGRSGRPAAGGREPLFAAATSTRLGGLAGDPEPRRAGPEHHWGRIDGSSRSLARLTMSADPNAPEWAVSFPGSDDGRRILPNRKDRSWSFD
jgi:hypothetical protein